MAERLDRMRQAVANKGKPPAPAPAPESPVAEPEPTPLPVAKKPKKPKPPKPPKDPKARDEWHKVKGRLPHGAEFDVKFDAESTTWSGRLTIDTCPTFEGTASGVFYLLTQLDEQYREWLRQQPAN